MIIRMVVDLPEPLAPRNPVTWPGSTSKLSPFTATVRPYLFCRFLISIIGPPGWRVPPHRHAAVRAGKTTLGVRRPRRNPATARIEPGVFPMPSCADAPRPMLAGRAQPVRSSATTGIVRLVMAWYSAKPG